MRGRLPSPRPTGGGHPNGFVATRRGRQALGETDLGSYRQCPPACGLAEGPRTLVQQRPGLAGPSIEDRRRGVRARGLWLHREAALVKRVKRIAHSLVGAAQIVGNHGRGLALGTGEEDFDSGGR